MKYRVLRTCFFDGSRFRAGAVAEFPGNVQPPHHFEPLDNGKTVIPPADAPRRGRPPKRHTEGAD